MALVAWLIAAAAMSQPGGSNPFAVAIALGLCAFAVATAEPPRAGRDTWLRCAAAGGLVALAGFWRVDFGLFAGLAVGVALALAPGERALRVRAVGTFTLTAAGLGLALYTPFAIAAGPGTLYEQMVADALKYASYWRLPFPLAFDEVFRLWPPGALAEDLKDLVGFYVPLALVAGLVAGAAACLVRWRWEGRPWRWLGLLVYALGAATYMRSRADEFHTQPLLVALTALLACAAVWLARERGRRIPAGGLLLAGSVAVLVLVGVYGTANRVSALLLPPELEPVGLPGTGGVKAPPKEAAVLRRVVPYVQARVPPGEPIFVAPRRSDLVRFDNLIFYILADRDTVLDAGATLQACPPSNGAPFARSSGSDRGSWCAGPTRYPVSASPTGAAAPAAHASSTNTWPASTGAWPASATTWSWRGGERLARVSVALVAVLALGWLGVQYRDQRVARAASDRIFFENPFPRPSSSARSTASVAHSCSIPTALGGWCASGTCCSTASRAVLSRRRTASSQASRTTSRGGFWSSRRPAASTRRGRVRQRPSPPPQSPVRRRRQLIVTARRRFGLLACGDQPRGHQDYGEGQGRDLPVPVDRGVQEPHRRG